MLLQWAAATHVFVQRLGISKHALLDSLGLALYITWSFVFWNGSILLGDTGQSASLSGVFIVQGFFTSAAALLVALSVRWIAPFFKHAIVLFGFAAISSISIVLAASVSFWQAPIELMLIGFALSGTGSTLRLGWEEHLSIQGAKHTALCVGIAYLTGFVLFSIISLLPVAVALTISFLLPFIAGGLLLYAGRNAIARQQESHETTPRRDIIDTKSTTAETRRVDTDTAPTPQLLFAHIPWKLIAAVALAYFSYGATRAEGVAGGIVSSGTIHGSIAGIPALVSLASVALAYYFYRKNTLLAFYLAFPLMALAALLPTSLDPFAGGTTFYIALMGAELVKYLVWYLLIDTIIKDGVSALLCLALLRFAQWGGSTLGQVSSSVLPSTNAVTIAILLSLMVALLVIIGAPFESNPSKPKGSVIEKPSTLERRILATACQYQLSPREKEVLEIWATGRSLAFVEKRLFISRNTVKTHLNHIYAKTETANREELLELLDTLDVSQKQE
jgi:DNA-binding CsgD family transcriptional regulator